MITPPIQKTILKIFLSFFLALSFLLLTQIKFSKILGTEMKFSLGVILGPTLAKFFGISFGTLLIILTQIFGILLGIFQLGSMSDLFIFLPIISAGIFFSSTFKDEDKKKATILPALCIFFFLLHPIGVKVWFYSLFWIIPIFLIYVRISKIELFLKSLATAFVDHAIGSIIYLYLLNIPEPFWIEAIPLTIMERIFIGFGISICYSLGIQMFKALSKIPPIAKLKELVNSYPQ